MGLKIAIMGSQPASVGLAPFKDPDWQIWGCSPGLFYQVPRLDAWFELHRWEPPAIGDPTRQRPWFSPEYVQWMGLLKCPVWMLQPVREVPTSRALPVEQLIRRWGTFHFTSTIAWMLAMAIDTILEQRAASHAAAAKPGAPVRLPGLEAEAIEVAHDDMIGLWGVDMSAGEEYVNQRPHCQLFVQIAASLGIKIALPPESDLMMPPPLYGIHESHPKHVKLMTRIADLNQRLAHTRAQLQGARDAEQQILGAIDSLNYMMHTWMHDTVPTGTVFEELFGPARVPAYVEPTQAVQRIDTGQGSPAGEAPAGTQST